jgi:hypothetical protein
MFKFPPKLFLAMDLGLMLLPQVAEYIFDNIGTTANYFIS